MSDTSSATSSAGSIREEQSEPDTSTTFQCLFCKDEFQTVTKMFEHVEGTHKFPIRETIKEIGSKLDELGVIKLINYLRLKSQESGADFTNLHVKANDLTDDKYLAPVLDSDPVLWELGDFMPTDNSEEQVTSYDEFEARLNLTQNLPDHVEKVDMSEERDERYFESYKGNSIHREMIEDRIRTESYMNFISSHAHLFKDKVVLDVGCGTGILSLFCARAGARKVFAVDNSDIASRAREIVSKNGYGDIVQVIQGKAEDFNTASQIRAAAGEGGKVDVIVSEWMGYGLLFEGMLDSVLKARDLYLAPNGLMVPSHCTLRVAPVSDKEWISESIGETFWKDVYGFDFSTMIPGSALNEHEIGVFDVPEKAVCGAANTFYEIDIATITVPELDFTVPFEVKMTRDTESLDAFTIWFDTFFLSNSPQEKGRIALKDADAVTWEKEGKNGVAFSTGPFGTSTHWHQAVVLLGKDDRKVNLKAGDVLKGSVTYRKRRRDVRGIEVDITWEGQGAKGKVSRSMA